MHNKYPLPVHLADIIYFHASLVQQGKFPPISAVSSTMSSLTDKPLAKHYREKHSNYNGKPQLKLEIVDKGSSLIDRKIKEAKFLVHNKPSLNDKSELNNLTQFLVA